MEGHLSAVAVGAARTELSTNIRLMGRFFEQGVPADDDTCVRMMRALPDSGLGGIHLNISVEFWGDLRNEVMQLTGPPRPRLDPRSRAGPTCAGPGR